MALSQSNSSSIQQPGERYMLYRRADIKNFLKNRHIVVIGDSVQRGTYKDLVLALQEERLLTPSELKAKGEDNFMNDVLVYRSELTNGKEYCEIREYQSVDGQHLVQYYFVTRCYGERIEAIFEEFKSEMPDIVIMNSCMWDTARYGPKSEEEYQKNMAKLLTRVREVLPPTSTFLWLTALPLASQIVGGFLLDEISFMSETLRVSILEANYYITQLCIQYGFDVLDLHFYMRPFIHHRQKDGVHWDGFACRHVTDLILTFLHDSYQIPLPKHTAEQAKRCQQDSSVVLNTRVFNHDLYPEYVDLMLKKISLEQSGLPMGEDEEMKSCEGQNYFEVQQRGELLVANVVASAGAPQNHPSPPVSTAENQIEMRDESPPAI